MQFILRLIITLVMFESSLPQAHGCVQKVTNVILKTTTTASPDLPSTETSALKASSAAEPDQEESVNAIDAKLVQGGGFYMEIEESSDHSVKVRHFKELPPIYSQIINNETHTPTEPPQPQEEQNVTEIENVEYKVPPPPSIVSLTEESSVPSWSAEDEAVRKDWGGTCSSSNWSYCNKIRKIQVMNVFTYIKDRDVLTQHLDLDCLLEDVYCLFNGWTANRCHILCMSKCNRAILLGWETLVSYKGQCKYVRRK